MEFTPINRTTLNRAVRAQTYIRGQLPFQLTHTCVHLNSETMGGAYNFALVIFVFIEKVHMQNKNSTLPGR